MHALCVLAQLLADVGRQEEAEVFFEKAIAIGERATSDAREALGLALGWYAASVEGKGVEGAAKAEALYQQALCMNPMDCLTLGNWAVFLHKIKRDGTVRAAFWPEAPVIVLVLTFCCNDHYAVGDDQTI